MPDTFPPGWGVINRNESSITWGRVIATGRLTIKKVRDEITGECKIIGSIQYKSILPRPHSISWLIKYGRKFQSTYSQKDSSIDIENTDSGPGEPIEENVSTPEMMAAYLERLAREDHH